MTTAEFGRAKADAGNSSTSTTMKALAYHGAVAMNDIMKAHDTFGNAAKDGTLKVVLTNGKLR